MTLKACLIRALVKNALYGLLLIAALVAINANVVVEQEPLPEGVSECWNPHTAQITIVFGTCTDPINPYVVN